MRLVLILLALAGCAPFAAKVDRVAEQRECLESWWCRNIFDDRPAYLFAGLNDEVNCERHAKEAKKRLGGRVAYGYVAGQRHALLIVDEWVIDNGALTPLRIFPVHELEHLWEPE